RDASRRSVPDERPRRMRRGGAALCPMTVVPRSGWTGTLADHRRCGYPRSGAAGRDGREEGNGMAEYRLHCFAQSGNSYKVALALELAGADWEPVWVDFFRGAHRAPEFVALNSMGEVPVLEHEGRVMSQSGIILDYLTDA